ncbi:MULTISPECIES: type II toxin-antitoxin system death-on-curing family toxin [Desulfovibrio]|uniref:Death on curing protein n=1 Tax=Desulfovibrio desulfuricans TaxID=876 RepID=A0AA94HU57_DESDE|nr:MULTISPECIES: type II toxin-antitoxin system death-on-curing family toxin [Desulfovibrio]ATD82205.1 type II toxin-antitoxin system death-on-curing family toxin [Desulfovibrio sp. G11]SFW63525.1 death on curing protein [Desulfovibrio desulfuricans]SPD34832.1 Death on curing protein, toxin-antitoxin system [Desulfovibrio sp. G11]
MSRDYLTVADILGMHVILVERYGGMPGVRDMGGLESAVYRPQSGYYTDAVEEACALLESLLINHPFVDGNKRTAFAACSVFLQINGRGMRADSDWLYAAIIRWLQLPPSERFSTMLTDLRTITE